MLNASTLVIDNLKARGASHRFDPEIVPRSGFSSRKGWRTEWRVRAFFSTGCHASIGFSGVRFSFVKLAFNDGFVCSYPEFRTITTIQLDTGTPAADQPAA